MKRNAFFILAAIVLAAFLARTILTENSAAAFVPAEHFFACSPIPTSVGGSINGRLETGDCVETNSAFYDGYTFSADPGEALDITVTSVAFVPSLRLVQGSYPGGAVIATGADPGNGIRRIGAFNVPAAGTYTVVASSAAAGASGDYSLTLETTNPRVDSIQRLSVNPAASGSTVAFSVSFTSPVTGVDVADFALQSVGVSGASITNVAGTESVYTVAVNSGSGSGMIRLDLIDNDTIRNASNIPLGGPGAGNGTYTSGPSYTIVSGTPTPTPPPSQTAVVTNTADDGPGSLRQAIADVLAGGTVTFSSLFSTPQTIVLSSGELRILKNVTINGPGPDLLTVSGNNASRVFNIGQSSPGFTVSISGLRIINGRAPDSDFGGGIEQNFGTLTLSDCVFSGNSAPATSQGVGGAIDFFDGTLSINNCTISGNSASTTGGGIAVGSSAVTITNSTLSGNTATGGAALHITGGTVTISGSTLNANTADFQGGAAFAQNCALTITNSTISGNIASRGAGVVFESTSGARTGQFTSTTVANNLANPNEGAILVIGRSNAAASVSLSVRNSLFAANSEPSLRILTSNGAAAGIVSQGFNLANGSGNGFLLQATDRVNAAAGIEPLAGNGGRTQTHALLPSSAAIDAGSGFGLSTDQRGGGFIRPIDLAAVNANGSDGTDIGAFELQSEPPPAFATISGRVTTPAGLGLRNAVVTLTDPQNTRRTATTSSFGIYTFTAIPTGQNYIIAVTSKRYRFAPQTLTITTNLANIDFVGLE